jgi:putative oxidoreductase
MKPFLARFGEAAYAAMRIVLALLYLAHGLRWLFGMFGGSPVPLNTMLLSAGIIETTCGTLMVLGLLTPYAAFVASGEMAAAFFIAHVPRGGWPIQNAGELPIALCFAFLYICTRGGGRFSIDAMLGRQPVGAISRTA